MKKIEYSLVCERLCKYKGTDNCYPVAHGRLNLEKCHEGVDIPTKPGVYHPLLDTTDIDKWEQTCVEHGR